MYSNLFGYDIQYLIDEVNNSYKRIAHYNQQLDLQPDSIYLRDNIRKNYSNIKRKQYKIKKLLKEKYYIKL